jgi:hypothetical protein
MTIDASILFPNDKPAGSREPPEYFKAERAAAESRLMGSQKRDDAAEGVRPADGKEGDGDPAKTLFPDDAAHKDVNYERVVGGELDQAALDAIKDGDADRADAIKHARDALATDFQSAGSDPADVEEALTIVRQSAGLELPTPAAREQQMSDAMAELTASGVTDADLNATRAFVRDLEIVAPETIASLERYGAGNNPRLVRKAIAEAKRRGYR